MVKVLQFHLRVGHEFHPSALAIIVCRDVRLGQRAAVANHRVPRRPDRVSARKAGEAARILERRRQIYLPGGAQGQ